jgi:hypothetical protein
MEGGIVCKDFRYWSWENLDRFVKFLIRGFNEQIEV